jgi:hypothetical protein
MDDVETQRVISRRDCGEVRGARYTLPAPWCWGVIGCWVEDPGEPYEECGDVRDVAPYWWGVMGCWVDPDKP